MTDRPLSVTCLPLQVWVVGELHNDKKLYWRADSDSELTKASSPPSLPLSLSAFATLPSAMPSQRVFRP